MLLSQTCPSPQTCPIRQNVSISPYRVQCCPSHKSVQFLSRRNVSDEERPPKRVHFITPKRSKTFSAKTSPWTPTRQQSIETQILYTQYTIKGHLIKNIQFSLQDILLIS